MKGLSALALVGAALSGSDSRKATPTSVRDLMIVRPKNKGERVELIHHSDEPVLAISRPWTFIDRRYEDKRSYRTHKGTGVQIIASMQWANWPGPPFPDPLPHEFEMAQG